MMLACNFTVLLKLKVTCSRVCGKSGSLGNSAR